MMHPTPTLSPLLAASQRGEGENILGAQTDRRQPANQSSPSLADENGRAVAEESGSAPPYFTGRVETGGDAPARERAGELRTTGHANSSHAADAVQASQSAGGVGNRATSQFAGHLTPALSPLASDANAEREKNVSTDDIETATKRQTAIEAFRALRAQGVNRKIAARKVGYPHMTLYWWQKAYDAEGFDGLLPQHKNSGRKPKNKFTAQQAADVRALVLQTNRSATSGSTPEAVRVAMKRGLLDPELTSLIKMRFDAGQHPLTPAMREQVRVSEATTFAARSPRNAWLQLVQSPGSLMLTRDEVTGEEREIEPCEQGTMDDGTINFVCCVPFNLPGNQCSERFGVMPGRFQFILPVDHRSYFIPGFNYTARPRSSYRAEDLTATLHTVFTEHGYWRKMVLEHGVSAAKLLSDTLELLGIQIIRASSPHQKVVEAVFNKLWTKLSLMPGQVGRYRGEEEEIQSLLGSCQRGATDPRKHFPMLGDVLKALHEAIAEHNSQLVKSVQYGRWVPRDLWDRFAKKNLRQLSPSQAWMFSPVITDPITVRGFKVRKTVCLMEGYSEVFDFGAEFLADYNGALVKLYFNPFAPHCVAQVVLAANWHGKKAGTVLGEAEQINRMTKFRRRAFGYSEDFDTGLDAVKRHAQALRRSVVAIRSDGTAGAQTHEARNGVGDSERLTNDPRLAVPAPTSTPLQRHRRAAAGVSDEQFDRQAAKLARDEARQANRKNTLVVESDD